MAYDLVRRYPDASESHEAMILAMGLGAGQQHQPTIPAVDRAGVGTAVALKDTKAGEVTWYVIEDATDLKPTLREIGPGSTVAKAVDGKQAGDEAELAEAFGTKRRVVIDRILHKWVFRFEQSFHNHPSQFPDQRFYKSFHV